MLRWASASFLAKGTGDREELKGEDRVWKGLEENFSSRERGGVGATRAVTRKVRRGLEEDRDPSRHPEALEEELISETRAVRGRDPRCPSGVRRWAMDQKTASKS